ncbi:MAG TPA: EAL domain-containing protein [Verrucomicrobiae bacterium]|nr:EAL domain-containing protein [Verrucomicrobiae bacterium]
MIREALGPDQMIDTGPGRNRTVAAGAPGDGRGRSSDGHGQISALIADLVPGDSAETTARRISERVLSVDGVDFAAVAMFQGADGIRSLAAVGHDGIDIPEANSSNSAVDPRRRARIRRLRERAQKGAWIETRPPTDGSLMASAFARLGIRTLAMAPIDLDGNVIGFIQVGSCDRGSVPSLTALLPTLLSLGQLASLLLAPQLGLRAELDDRRAAIIRMIERRAFRSVYQPIVMMPTGRIVGFEALTRFADRSRPELTFAAAARVGLGIDLEVATITAAIAEAAALPRDAWLDLNVSPELLEDTSRLSYLLWKAAPRPIVLEVTEHEAIEDYGRLRQRVADLGIPVRLAVDDAGAGFASLRHVLELRPAIIKLDRSLVAEIDVDPVRQGLVVGLRHFAAAAGSTVLAEGIETIAQRDALLNLGVELGQGYLLGRPAPVTTVLRRRADHADPPVIARETGGTTPPELVHRVGAILWEADGTEERMTFVSEGSTALTGHPAARWLMEPRFWEDHLHADDRPAVLAAMSTAIGSEEHVSLQYRFRLADGSYRWFEDVVEVLPGTAGHVRLVGVMIDVTERRHLQEQLAHRVSHDPLTGLLNREGLHEIVSNAVSAPSGGVAAILFLDIDRFKLVNDSLGHGIGDDLLRLIAGRLKEAVRESDAVARVGGDEFVVFATCQDAPDIVALGRRLVDALAAPYEVGGRILSHPASVGIAYLAPGEVPDHAIREADIAMYAAKQAGGNRPVVYEPAMLDAALARLDRVDPRVAARVN